MINKKEILIKSKDYLETNGWRRGSVPLDEWRRVKDSEVEIPLCLQDAVTMMIIIHGKPNSVREYMSMLEPVLSLCDTDRYGNLRYWNDTQATKEDVFKLLDEAIAKCE